MNEMKIMEKKRLLLFTCIASTAHSVQQCHTCTSVHVEQQLQQSDFVVHEKHLYYLCYWCFRVS